MKVAIWIYNLVDVNLDLTTQVLDRSSFYGPITPYCMSMKTHTER